MWHGFVSRDGMQIYAKGKPYRESDNTITAKTKKELFAKLDRIANNRLINKSKS